MSDTSESVGLAIMEPVEPVVAPERRRWHVLLVLPGILAVCVGVLLAINLMGIGPMWFERVVLNGPAWKNFVLDTFLLCLLLGVVVFLTGRFWVPATIFGAIGFLVAFSNSVKLDVRNEPLFPSDLTVAGNTGFLSDMVSADTLLRILLTLVLIVVVAAVLARVLRRRLPRVRRAADPRFWKLLLVTRLVCALICAALIADAAYFNTPGNLWRKAYERAGSEWKPWDQDRNYRRNGFVGGFLYNLNGPTMTKPEDYSEATMAALVTKYSASAERTNATRKPGVIDDVNVVVVLSEAFSDPLRIKGVTFGADPIPRTRELLGETHSGNMLTQLIGGGTANMEFEVFTGLSSAQFAPQLTTPYQMLVPRFDKFPGSVRYFRDLGHEALAIHPYSTRMYKRTTAYPALGFEKFIYNETMQSRDKLPGSRFISDEAAFAEVDHQIAQADSPTFVNLVTMQNHYPWNKQFEEPFPVTGVSGAAYDQVSRYARGLNYTDESLQEWLTGLEQSEEKTAVIFYGDHLPGAYPAKVREQNSDRSLHETPFFLWTNFQKLPHTPQPTTSPIYFLPTLFDQLGARVPAYYSLLSAMHEEIPAMEQGRYITADNREVSEKQLSQRAKELLHDYRLVQYDLAAGEGYSRQELFTPPD